MTEIPLPPGLAKIAKAHLFEPNEDARSYDGDGYEREPFDDDHERRRRFELVPFEKIAVGSKSVYLVKGVIPRTGLALVYGPPKCGKSFWTFDLVMHVALGWQYRGRRVKQGAVVYCALEGAEGFRRRVEAFRQAKLSETTVAVPFHLILSPMNLVADHTAFIGAIRATLGEVEPAVVVIDTLNRSLAGSESDDRDMAAYIRAADAIRDAFGCAVIVVHHCGHEGTRPRGHSSLLGAADAQISVKRDAMDNIVVTVDWMKDGPQGEEIVSRLRPVDIGIDEDGETITSCVVEKVEGPALAKKTVAGAKLTKGAKIALAAIREALNEVGEIPPASNHIPQNVKAVMLQQWREYAYRQGISGSADARARQMAFQRAHETLVAAKQVAVWEPYAWIV